MVVLPAATMSTTCHPPSHMCHCSRCSWSRIFWTLRIKFKVQQRSTTFLNWNTVSSWLSVHLWLNHPPLPFTCIRNPARCLLSSFSLSDNQTIHLVHETTLEPLNLLHETWYWRTLWKTVEPFQFSFRLDKFNTHITRRPTFRFAYILSVTC